MVVGNLFDSTNQEFVNDAVIEDENGNVVYTVATPDDPNLEDGFYMLFLPTGTHTLTATREPYPPVTINVTVNDLGVIQQDIEVRAEELPDYAMQFDGYDDYVDAGNGQSLNLTGSLTIEAWINPSGWGEGDYGFGRIADKEKFLFFLNGYYNENYNDNSLVFTMDRADGSFVSVNTPENSIYLDTWQHVAVTYDGLKEVKIYINGIEQELIYPDDMPSGLIADNREYPLLIGESAKQDRAFEGMIDELRIWNIARNADEIQTSMYKSLTGKESGLVCYFPMSQADKIITDLSDNGNKGTVHGVTWVKGILTDEMGKTPGNLKVSEYSAKEIKLIWQPPIITDGLLGYNIYRDEEKKNTEPVKDTTYTDMDIQPGYGYSYAITAVYTDGFEGVKTEAVFAITHNPFIFVNDDATGENNGTSWQNAFTELQSALNIAVEGDKIWVAAGVYKPDYDLTNAVHTGKKDTSFELKNGVAIYGGFAGTESGLDERDWNMNIAVLSGDIGVLGDATDNTYQVLYASDVDSTAILDGFTITGGTAGNHRDTEGGGMYNYESSPTLCNLIFTENSAEYGGGMYNKRSSPILTNVIFRDNYAEYQGGGMYNYHSNLKYYHSNPKLNYVVFINNSADDKIYGGGGMSNEGSSPELNHVTFFGNRAANNGGGIYNEVESNPTIINCILWGNTAENGGDQIYNTPASSADVTYSIVQGGWEGEGNLDKDPLFVDAENGDFTLKPDSPAIGTGKNGEDMGAVVTLKIRGDADGSGETDIFDAPIIAEYDSGLKTEDELKGFVFADFDKNGDVDINDALMIAMYDAGLIESLD